MFDDITDEALAEREENEGTNETAEIELRIQREFKMTLWIVSVLLLTYLIGFLNALAIFLFAFIYNHEKSILRAALITVVSIISIKVFFVEILTLQLWDGIVFSSALAVTTRRWGDYDE